MKGKLRRMREKCRREALSNNEGNDRVRSLATAFSNPNLELEEAPCDKKNSVETLLKALYEKRESTRKKALLSLVGAFSNSLQNDFLEKNFVTLLYQLLNSFKRVSVNEICLASHLIGLMAVTVGCGDKGHEILEEAISPISHSLKSVPKSSKLASVLLDCLAIVTFVGGNDPEETERSLQIIWQFIHPKSDSNMVSSEPSTAILTTAISAWAFLFTTVDGWRWKLEHKNWQESVSYISSLLDKDDISVRIAAGEALAVIFDIGILENFSHESKDFSENSVHEGNNSWEGCTYIRRLKGKIINQVRNLFVEASSNGLLKRDISSQHNFFRDFLKFLEDGYSPKASMKIGNDSLNTSTWSRLIQLNFLKRFLGGGFIKHMQENDFLHDVFGFVPKRKLSLIYEQNISSFETVLINLYVPKVRKQDCTQRLQKSPCSIYNKARTQFLNKERMLTEARKTGHFSVAFGEDCLN